MIDSPSMERLLLETAWLRRFAADLVGSSDADDVAQETLLRAWRFGAKAREPRAWLAPPPLRLARLTTLTTSAISVVMTEEERTTLYLRGVPRAVVKQAKVAAAQRGTTLAAFVTEAMQRSLGSKAAPDSAELADPLAGDFAWLEAHRDRLVRKYEGLYVAIVNGEVIDHDSDFSALAQRVFRRGGVRPVLMPRVTRAAPVVHLRSPRRKRA